MSKNTYHQTINCPEGMVPRTTLTPMRYLNEPHSRIYDSALMDLASNKNLTLTDLRVYLCLISLMEFENRVCKSQGQIAEIIRVHRAEVNKSIKRLIEQNCLKIIDKIGTQNVYAINPKKAFRSRAKNYKLLVEDWDGKDDENQYEDLAS